MVAWVEYLLDNWFIMNHNESIKFGVNVMSYKVQITVDERLNKTLKAKAKTMGLSVSSYARLALMSVVAGENNKLLNQAINDIQSNDTEVLTLTDFNNQLDSV